MTESRDRPKVSISILTYEGEQWIGRCIDSILKQTYRPLEIVVVDNNSSDGTRRVVRERLLDCSFATLVDLDRNVGYPSGQNIGIAHCTGDIICLLNQDTELDPGFIDQAASALMRTENVAAVQGCILRLDEDGGRTDVIDTTGIAVSRDRRMLSRGQGTQVGDRPESPGLIFGVDGPAPVYRRAALEAARVLRRDGRFEILDEDFFLYHEDTDLAWRLRLLGWDAIYVPGAVGWHARGSSGPSRLDPLSLARRRRKSSPHQGLSWRNQRLMMLKNELVSLLLRDALHIAYREAGSIVLLLLSGRSGMGVLVSFVKLMPSAFYKRREIQRRRRLSARQMGVWFKPRARAADER